MTPIEYRKMKQLPRFSTWFMY